jgi:leucyl aminopeptidase
VVILLDVPEQSRPVDVAAVGFGADGRFDGADTLPLATAELISTFLQDEGPQAEAGTVLTLQAPGAVPHVLLLVGVGDRSPDAIRVAAVAVGRAVRKLDEQHTVGVAIDAPDREQSTALAEGLILGGYEFSRRTSSDEGLHTVHLVGTVNREGLSAGDEAADAAGWARDLGNMPAAELTPQRLAELATDQLEAAGCQVTVRDEEWLRQRGFGGIVAVGAASANPPRMIEVTHRPRRRPGTGGADLPHVVLVGKGITFDTGGLNLKPPAAMQLMHTDMCGGAAVLAAVQYAAMRHLPVRVTVLVPTAENAVSGTAMRPSDVIRQYGGRTTEIGNTDAEGRLILADALAYAVARLKPDLLIDIATLTGAMKVALGLETAGYFANDDALAGRLERAARASGEQIWRMPLEHQYASALESPVADARNDPGNPGGITAALFLQPFTGSVPWAHLDIAGPARAAEDGAIFSRGATGFGARLLGRLLEDAAV